MIDLGAFELVPLTATSARNLNECAFACAENETVFVAAQFDEACRCARTGPPGVLDEQLRQCAPLACDATAPRDDACGIVQGVAGADASATATSVFLPRRGAPMQYEAVAVVQPVGAASMPSDAPRNSVLFPRDSFPATTKDLQPWVVLTREVMDRRKLKREFDIKQAFVNGTMVQSLTPI